MTLALLEPECATKGPDLWPGEHIDLRICGPQELTENGEREARIGLATGRPQRRHLLRRRRCDVVQQHGLAHTRLARDEQRAAPTLHSTVEERLERGLLRPAADQHLPILIDVRVET